MSWLCWQKSPCWYPLICRRAWQLCSVGQDDSSSSSTAYFGCTSSFEFYFTIFCFTFCSSFISSFQLPFPVWLLLTAVLPVFMRSLWRLFVAACSCHFCHCYCYCRCSTSCFATNNFFFSFKPELFEISLFCSCAIYTQSLLPVRVFFRSFLVMLSFNK